MKRQSRDRRDRQETIIETIPKMSRSAERILKLLNEASSIGSARLVQSPKFASKVERLGSIVVRGDDIIIQSSLAICLVNNLRAEDRWYFNIWE